MNTKDALALVADERLRQIEKWGDNRLLHPEQWLRVAMEELGEVARAIEEYDTPHMVMELVQVAAVCVAAVENWQGRKLMPIRRLPQAAHDLLLLLDRHAPGDEVAEQMGRLAEALGSQQRWTYDAQASGFEAQH